MHFSVPLVFVLFEGRAAEFENTKNTCFSLSLFWGVEEAFPFPVSTSAHTRVPELTIYG